ncbi:MAG: FISUMP domain-containing protein [Bacteroidales bacterium]|nr:FISUMP domain-containing protein [Bacteroidales bacterium]
MEKSKILLLSLLISLVHVALAQVAINSDGSAPDESAMLDVKSTTGGLLLPRLTNVERDAIISPAAGLVIFNTDEEALQVYNGSSWKYLSLGSCVPQQPSIITGNDYPDCNQTGVTYSIAEVSYASSYNWTVPVDAIIVSGQGATNVTIDFGVTSGNVSVRTENTCGESEYTNLEITIREFLCGDQYEDSRDSQIYNTISIGSQCWFVENLNIGIRIDAPNSQTDNGTIEKYCFNNDDTNCTVYGGLYQWDEMMEYVPSGAGVQGICPDGWHIPYDGEWTSLSDFLGGASVAGGKMKESGYVHWNSPNTDATNSSGFTGLPGGFRRPTGWSSMGLAGYFSSSNESSSTQVWTRNLYYENAQLTPFNGYLKKEGLSVRCLKN